MQSTIKWRRRDYGIGFGWRDNNNRIRNKE